MRHRMDSRSLGRYGSHRMAMLSNMAASLFLEENITTTLIRAKELRRFAERLITRAKGGTIHDRRIVRSKMAHKEAAIKLFDDIAKRYVNRPGGYTRIVKTGFRAGDNASMAVISLVE
ncbi:MAG TPA: 50S ribosomal protein L17 [Synergistales bacterium]|nr:50S ribosomal protein L17 [Synergistaceae bacterium]NLD96053.1 50S ribosomal protein L17 [Synergistaceae bacterium]HPE65302.1 50S ribosomal protein L17 [Synergistales bacterium]